MLQRLALVHVGLRPSRPPTCCGYPSRMRPMIPLVMLATSGLVWHSREMSCAIREGRS